VRAGFRRVRRVVPRSARAGAVLRGGRGRKGVTIQTQNRALVERACPVCGSRDDSHVLADSTFDPARLDGFAYASRKLPEYQHHRLVACPICDVVYASPAPTAESLVRSYAEADYDSAVEATLAAETYERLLRPLLARLPDRDGAIDV